MKDFGKRILRFAIILLALYIVAIVAVSSFKEGGLEFNFKYAFDGVVLAITIIGGLGYITYFLLGMADGKFKKKSSKNKDEVEDLRGNKTSQFFNRDFVTEEELKKNKAFNYCNLTNIRSVKKDGILVRAEEKGNGLDINFVEPIHTLCVGTTSSGKTSRFVVPTLQLMSMTAAKPSFVVTDPKGELYDKCKNKLEKEGYNVQVLNMREPFQSVQWNPLSYPYDLWHRSFNLDKEVKVHGPGDNPKDKKLIMQREFDYMTQNWFEFDGVAYVDKSSLEANMANEAKDLMDKTFTALGDISTTICPITSEKDPNWERTAQRLIQAVMLAMLEDSMDPRLGLTREKYNFYNVFKICNMMDGGRDNYKSLKTYLFEYRDKFSKVSELANTALNNADNTTKNYMGFVSGGLALFSDTGISLMTQRSEIDFIELDERPTAIFIVIPDEVRTRYPLAVLFVTQLYKRLVEKAQNRGGRLKRNVYFLLDEFGNMPKFPEFGSIMTVGRSRGIFFELCVQSYSQLYQVYGDKEGKIIKDNCPIQVYIASEDTQTNKEFSELLGKKTIVKKNENVSKGPDGKESKSYSEDRQSIPIAYPEELPSFRDKGEIVIKTFTPNCALKTKITSIYDSKNNVYDLTPVFGTFVQSKTFDESAIFYDARKRNEMMQSEEEDDDDDFDF